MIDPNSARMKMLIERSNATDDFALQVCDIFLSMIERQEKQPSFVDRSQPSER